MHNCLCCIQELSIHSLSAHWWSYSRGNNDLLQSQGNAIKSEILQTREDPIFHQQKPATQVELINYYKYFFLFVYLLNSLLQPRHPFTTLPRLMTFQVLWRFSCPSFTRHTSLVTTVLLQDWGWKFDKWLGVRYHSTVPGMNNKTAQVRKLKHVRCLWSTLSKAPHGIYRIHLLPGEDIEHQSKLFYTYRWL